MCGSVEWGVYRIGEGVIEIKIDSDLVLSFNAPMGSVRQEADVIECLETPAVARLANVNRSTLDYWVRTGLVRPSLRKSPGRRKTRLWSVQDAVVVRTIASLRASGAPLQRVRSAVKHLQQLWDGLQPDSHLVWDGSDIQYVTEWGAVESMVVRPGQQVLQVVALPVGHWADASKSGVRYISRANLSRGVPADTALEAMEAASG